MHVNNTIDDYASCKYGIASLKSELPKEINYGKQQEFYYPRMHGTIRDEKKKPDPNESLWRLRVA